MGWIMDVFVYNIDDFGGYLGFRLRGLRCLIGEEYRTVKRNICRL